MQIFLTLHNRLLFFLSLYVFGLKHNGPSALNDERQNLSLCASATVLLFSYCNETEDVRVLCVCVLTLCYCCLMVRLKGSDEDSITVACCSQPMA